MRSGQGQAAEVVISRSSEGGQVLRGACRSRTRSSTPVVAVAFIRVSSGDIVQVRLAFPPRRCARAQRNSRRVVLLQVEEGARATRARPREGQRVALRRREARMAVPVEMSIPCCMAGSWGGRGNGTWCCSSGGSGGASLSARHSGPSTRARRREATRQRLRKTAASNQREECTDGD